MNWIISQRHNGLRIRTYLQQEQRFSKRLIKQMTHNNGHIFVNNINTTAKHVLKTGDELEIILPAEKKGAMMTPEKMPLNILYEDDAILVLNKTAGRVTVPSHIHPAGTIAQGVLAHYEEQGLPFTFHIVTRLDRQTSGAMLVAKHQWSHSILAEAQQNQKIDRVYYAIVEGYLHQKQGIINAPIGRKDGSIIERTVRTDGKPAVTHYTVVREMAGHSLLVIRLETGRTHQIRVHFAYIGHPLAGDDLYGGSLSSMARQALHCYQLSFKHPMTNEQRTITSNLSEDFQSFLNTIYA